MTHFVTVIQIAFIPATLFWPDGNPLVMAKFVSAKLIETRDKFGLLPLLHLPCMSDHHQFSPNLSAKFCRHYFFLGRRFSRSSRISSNTRLGTSDEISTGNPVIMLPWAASPIATAIRPSSTFTVGAPSFWRACDFCP